MHLRVHVGRKEPLKQLPGHVYRTSITPIHVTEIPKVVGNVSFTDRFLLLHRSETPHPRKSVKVKSSYLLNYKPSMERYRTSLLHDVFLIYCLVEC